MKSKLICLSFMMLFVAISADRTQAKEINMKSIFHDGEFLHEEHIFRIQNPIRTHISITNTPENIQELHQVKLHVTYENPAGSGETGYFNTRLSYRDVGLFYKGKVIERGRWLPSEQKPRPPIGDDDFIKMKPGERRVTDWFVNLTEREMLEGTHQYELLIAGNHTLPSIKSKIYKETSYSKTPLTVDTQSNTVTFTYTKPSKDGKDTSNPPSPPVATPDKLNDAGNPDNLAPPRLPLGTQVSSLRSCPESGIYECPADAPGVTEYRLFIHKGRPMPNAFITQTKPGIAGVFGGQEVQEVETSWTLVAYE